jgi:hypothetical protein
MRRQAKQQPEIIYKWVEGTCIQNYAKSAQTWTASTNNADFLAKFQTLVENTSMGNDERATAVENLLL